MTAPFFSPSFQNQLEQLLIWRRDVRHFRTTPVPTSVLDELLETACLAPSVGLSEPWRFVLVNDANRRDAIRQNFMRSNTQELEGREGKTRSVMHA